MLESNRVFRTDIHGCENGLVPIRNQFGRVEKVPFGEGIKFYLPPNAKILNIIPDKDSGRLIVLHT